MSDGMIGSEESNAELRAIYEADQADRQAALHPDLAERDRARQERVGALLAAGAVRTADDYFHAALVFQHDAALEEVWRAHELAQHAAELGGGRRARWLAAAAYDRWLLQQRRPQKYGTQYVPEGDGYRLGAVDPATTDAERAEWGVPSLAEAQALADELTRSRPPALPERRGRGLRCRDDGCVNGN